MMDIAAVSQTVPLTPNQDPIRADAVSFRARQLTGSVEVRFGGFLVFHIPYCDCLVLVLIVVFDVPLVDLLDARQSKMIVQMASSLADVQDTGVAFQLASPADAGHSCGVLLLRQKADMSSEYSHCHRRCLSVLFLFALSSPPHL